jgi:hypothetical protein
MNDGKSVGLNVHQETISAAVVGSTGKLVMLCVLETKTAILLQYLQALGGSVHVSFEGET